MNKNLKKLAMIGLASGVLLTTQEGEAAYRRPQGSYIAQGGCGANGCGGNGSAYDDGYYNDGQYQQNRNVNQKNNFNNANQNANWKNIHPEDNNNPPANLKNNNPNGRDDPYAQPSYPSTYSKNSFQPKNQNNRNIANNVDDDYNEDAINDGTDKNINKKPLNRTKTKNTFSQRSPYKKINNKYYRTQITDAENIDDLDTNDDNDESLDDDLDYKNDKKINAYSKPSARNLNNGNLKNNQNGSYNGTYRNQNGNSSINGTNGYSR